MLIKKFVCFAFTSVFILPTAYGCSFRDFKSLIEGYELKSFGAERTVSNVKVKLDETDILGFIKEIDSQYYFESQKPWKYFRIRLDLSRCQYLADLKANERVLFRAEKNTDELSKLASSNKGTSGWALKSKNLSIFAEAVSNIEEYPIGHPNIFWKYCSEDSSCKNIKDDCNVQIGINQNFEEKYKNYFKNKKNIHCDSTRKLSNKTNSTCVQNFCS